MNLTNSIIANQLVGGDCSGFPTSNDYNLDSDGSCNLDQPNDKPNNPNANLGPLQNNGGPTETHALLVGSPPIDAAKDCTDIPFPPSHPCDPVAGTAVTQDQRGVSRPQGSACDIGAYEVQVPVGGIVVPVNKLGLAALASLVALGVVLGRKRNP